MSGDLLEAATRALREETDEAADGRHTRARVMASLHQGKVKRRTRLAFVLPLAACFAAGTAWGAATGRLPAVFHAIGRMVRYGNPPVAPAPPVARPAAASARQTPAGAGALADEAEASVLAPVPPEPARAPAPVLTPPAERVSEPAAPLASAKPSSSAAFSDQDGDLYRLAHEAHFGSHDYARALTGWDAYLRAAPRGRLAVEARYNRALCLLRLGRDEEAKRALQPFALGAFGYRQSEARQLLDELSRAQPE